jgi:site-specific DNA-methyltransferase (adenine-specific)
VVDGVAKPPASLTRAATSPQTAWTVLEGDCLDRLAELEAASVDAVVCDPPYGIDFQGERWDGPAIREAAARHGHNRLAPAHAYQAWCQTWADHCLRILRPGGHLVAFGSPRTAHRLACGLQDAGLELRDTLMWLYGTGIPKSRRLPGGRATTLKPAYEPIVLARRPLDRPTLANLERHGTGALNTDACQVAGRHPANLVLSHSDRCRPDRCQPCCPVALVDSAADRARAPSASRRQASRLFYCPKASRRERDAGCERLPRRSLDLFPRARHNRHDPSAARNPHPTVKPLALMRWLVRLATPPGGLVLDPFCGSGTTGAAARLERRRFLGIEIDPTYATIARARIAHHGPATGAEEHACRPFSPGRP